MKKFSILSLLLVIIQVQAGGQDKHENRQAVAYQPAREADIAWVKRTHSIIDSREKINMVMNWPRNHFYDILMEAVTTGRNGTPVAAFRDPDCIQLLDFEELATITSYEDCFVYYQDDDPVQDFPIDTCVMVKIPREDIYKYEIMEEWVFNSRTGMLSRQILAIAPIGKIRLGNSVLDEQPLFWVRFKDLRPILVKEEIFNRHNDARRVSYLDYFELNLFTSYIVKESNAFDNYIADFEEYQNAPMESLLKSQRVKNELMQFEQDLWER